MRRRPLILLLIFTGAGTIVRLLFLDAQPLWWDEGYSVYFATEPLPRLLALTSFDIHPPLYYVLLKGWFLLAGITPVRARLLSVALGLTAIPLLWLVALELWERRRVALLVTALLVVSPFHVYYSQEVRMYALLVVFTLLSMLGFLRGSRSGDRRWWTVTIVGLVGAMLTQYYGVFVVALVAVAWLWLRRERPTELPHLPEPRTAGLLLGVTVVAYLPWALYAGWRLYTYVSAKVVIERDAPMTPLEFPWRHAVAFSVGHLMPSQAWLASATLFFLVLAAIGIWCSRQRQRWQTGVTLIWLTVPLLGGFVINLIAPFTDARIERQMIPALPAFLLFVALGIEAITERQWSRSGRHDRAWNAIGITLLVLVFNLISLIGFYTIPRYPKDDYRPILSYVGARQAPDDVWLAVYPWQIGYLRAYLPARRPDEFFLPQDQLSAWSEDPAVREAGVAALYDTYARVWFPAFQIKGRILEERLADTLRQQGVPVWNEWVGNTRLWLTARDDTTTTDTISATFSGGLELQHVTRADQIEPSGTGVIAVRLGWDGAADDTVRFSLQLVGPGGHVWGEFDGPLTPPVTRAGLLVEPGTPPLEYMLRLRVYDAQSGQPYDVLGPDGNPLAPSLSLGPVRVTRPSSPLPTEALPAQHEIDATLGTAIRLVGATVATDTVKTGDTIPVTLFWQAMREVSEEYNVFVQALDQEGTVQAARDLAPVDGHFPTTEWQAGDLIRDPHDVPIGAGAPAGPYRLIAGLYNPKTGRRLPVGRGADHVPLGRFTVEARPHQFEPPSVTQEIGVSFGEEALLIGATIDWPAEPGRLSPGAHLPVRLVWQPLRTPPGQLRAFVQLLDADNMLGGNSDHRPGEAPTSAWIAGEYIEDRHTLQVQEGAQGTYRLVVGLYNPETGRLTTPAGTDVVELATVTIAP